LSPAGIGREKSKKNVYLEWSFFGWIPGATTLNITTLRITTFSTTTVSIKG